MARAAAAACWESVRLSVSAGPFLPSHHHHLMPGPCCMRGIPGSHKTHLLLRAPNDFCAPGWSPKRNLRLDLRGFDAGPEMRAVIKEDWLGSGAQLPATASHLEETNAAALGRARQSEAYGARIDAQEALAAPRHFSRTANGPEAADSEDTELTELAHALSPVKRWASATSSSLPPKTAHSRPLLGRVASHGMHPGEHVASASPSKTRQPTHSLMLSDDAPSAQRSLNGPVLLSRRPNGMISDAACQSSLTGGQSSPGSPDAIVAAASMDDCTAQRMYEVSTALEGLRLDGRPRPSMPSPQILTRDTQGAQERAESILPTDNREQGAASRPSRILPKEMRADSLLARARLSSTSRSSTHSSLLLHESRTASKPPKRAPPLAGGFIIDCGLSTAEGAGRSPAAPDISAPRRQEPADSSNSMWFVCEVVIPSYT